MTHRTHQRNVHKPSSLEKLVGRRLCWSSTDLQLGCERYPGINEVGKSHDVACRQRMAVLLCQLSKCNRIQKQRTHQSPLTRNKNLPMDFGAVAPCDGLLLLRRSDRGCHNSGIEVWILMCELGDMNKSLNAVTGVSQRGFDQLAREQRIYVREKQKLGGQAVTD